MFPSALFEMVHNVSQFLRELAIGSYGKETTGASQANVEKPFHEPRCTLCHVVSAHKKDRLKLQTFNELNTEDAYFGLSSENPPFETFFGLNRISLTNRLAKQVGNRTHI